MSSRNKETVLGTTSLGEMIFCRNARKNKCKCKGDTKIYIGASDAKLRYARIGDHAEFCEYMELCNSLERQYDFHSFYAQPKVKVLLDCGDNIITVT